MNHRHTQKKFCFFKSGVIIKLIHRTAALGVGKAAATTASDAGYIPLLQMQGTPHWVCAKPLLPLLQMQGTFSHALVV